MVALAVAVSIAITIAISISNSFAIAFAIAIAVAVAIAVAFAVAFAVAVAVAVTVTVAIAVAIAHCPLPSLLPWAIAVVAVNHCRHHLCCVTVSHRCCRCSCHWTLPSPSPLAIAVAIAIGHHHCHAIGYFRELLPWLSKNCIRPIEAKNAHLILFFWDSGRRIDQSRITYQVSSGNGQHQRWVASGKQ
jgi:hypothetical protein